MQPEQITKPLEINHDLTTSMALNLASRESAALFKYYLSVAEARGETVTAWRDTPDIITDEGFPERLNHYRRSPLASDDAAVNRYINWQQHLTALNVADISLWQAFHPDPLSFTNDATKIPVEVKHNCPYKTQLGWLMGRQNNQEPQEPDPTLLSEIIPAAQAYQF